MTNRLFPHDFPGRESKIHYFPEAASTMDIARDLAGKGCPDFTVVIAGRQKTGRGVYSGHGCLQKAGFILPLY